MKSADVPGMDTERFARTQVAHDNFTAQFKPGSSCARDLLQQEAVAAEDACTEGLLKAHAKLNLWGCAQKAMPMNEVLMAWPDFDRKDVPGDLRRKSDFTLATLRLVLGHEQGSAAGHALDRAKEPAAAAELRVRAHGDRLRHPAQLTSLRDDAFTRLQQQLQHGHGAAYNSALHSRYTFQVRKRMDRRNRMMVRRHRAYGSTEEPAPVNTFGWPGRRQETACGGRAYGRASRIQPGIMATLAAPRAIAAPPVRLLSLDVLRGITMAAMVLVNDPGPGPVFAQLDHAEWNGATFTDMIFPCFLVMVGIAMTLSFASRLNRGATHARLAFHAVRRGLSIVAVGLALNLLFTKHIQELRFAGVLQRIGVCYILASLLYLAIPGADRGRSMRRRTVLILSLALFCAAAYWALLKFYPTPGFGPGHLDTYMSLPAVVDRAVFGIHHIYRWGTTPGLGPTYDPEGVLSTLPALSNVLFGIVAGEILRAEKPLRARCGWLAAFGTTLWLAGLTLSHWLPLNKKLWTSTFALFTSGLSILALAGLLALIDMKKVRRGWSFFLIFGTNAILAYVLSDLLGWALGLVRWMHNGRHTTPLGYLFYVGLQPHLPAKIASLAYAIVYVCLVALAVYPLYRRRIFLRL